MDLENFNERLARLEEQNEFRERLARIEEKLNTMNNAIPRITELLVAQARAEASAASAHKRIDNIYRMVGVISTVVSAVISIAGRTF